MTREYKGIMPYDPILDIAYINAIGENKTEASVNLDLCENDEEILKRIEFIPIKILSIR